MEEINVWDAHRVSREEIVELIKIQKNQEEISCTKNMKVR